MTNILVGNIEERTSDSIQQLPEEQRQKLISAFKDSISKDLTEKWAEQTTTRIVDDALSYLKGEQEGLTAVKNLSWQDVSI